MQHAVVVYPQSKIQPNSGGKRQHWNSLETHLLESLQHWSYINILITLVGFSRLEAIALRLDSQDFFSHLSDALQTRVASSSMYTGKACIGRPLVTPKALDCQDNGCVVSRRKLETPVFV